MDELNELNRHELSLSPLDLAALFQALVAGTCVSFGFAAFFAQCKANFGD